MKQLRDKQKGEENMERWELLLLFLGFDRATSSSIDPVRIMKGMFLLEKHGGLMEHSYYFEPYDYGPFSIFVYRDLDLLEAKGLVERIPSPGRNWSYVRLTEEGRSLVEDLRKKATEQQLELISDVYNQVWRRGFAELLRYIYKEYPEYAGKSVF